MTQPAKSVQLVKGNGPAVDLSKVREKAVDLAKKADKAGISLSKRGLDGIRAQAVLLLDHSGSMRRDYKSGVVQTLVERSLGFALQIDVDGEIPVIAFDSKVWPAVTVTVDNYSGIVDREILQSKMGTTNLAAALEVVLELAQGTDAPLFVIVITDGSPDSKPKATRIVCELSRYPCFIKFLAIQDVDYLQELDDLDDSKRLLDNVDAKTIKNPEQMSDLEFADAMTDEWDTWISAAQRAGILG